MENTFGRLEARFRCLHCARDIDINTLHRVMLSGFILNNYCEIKNERLPEQNFLSSLNCEKRATPPKSNVIYKESINENPAKNIRNLFALYFE